MARKASGKKTGVAEKATAAEVETTAAAQDGTATGNEQGTETDPALVNTGDTGVDNETVTAGSAAEVETTADETGGASGETDDEDDPEKVKQEPKTGTGFQFNVSSDGFVEVISEKRAGKSVTGATGEIITFDDKGYAKVKLEDAIHFSQVPGFSFK